MEETIGGAAGGKIPEGNGPTHLLGQLVWVMLHPGSAIAEGQGQLRGGEKM
jgi:hypothetical protein